MNNQPIGILDSGVGGLTILQEIKKLLPNERFIFVADQGYFPYGEKSQQELEERVSKIAHFLLKNKVKIIIVACNTATIHAIEHLRKKYQLPIIGVVPVVKTISQLSKTKKTAVFSTPATAKSPYLKALIKKFAPDVTVYRIGGTGLEGLIETGDISSKKIDKILHESLKPLLKKNVDAIALGCTHYPFLNKKIRAIVGKNVQVVDSGGAVARRTKTILENNHILSNERAEDFYYTTGDKQKFAKAMELLLNKKITNISRVTL